MSTTRKIAVIVGLLYFLISVVMFRGVIASIPSILHGDAVINADELVPFFNPTSQLIEQAAGKFVELTNGYEFRVRYSMLTTWMRYYKILPFALVLVLPMTWFWSYLAVAWFLSKVMIKYRAEKIYILTVPPNLVIFFILTFTKITTFYTLIVGFSLFLVAVILVTYGLIFALRKPYKYIILACVITLLNPAVHYLILFALYISLTVVCMVLIDMVAAFRSGAWRNVYRPRAWRSAFVNMRCNWKHLIVENRLWRCVGTFLVLLSVTIIPYWAFVTFYVLKGVGSLSETVPSDYYFIKDASITLTHLLAFDMPGIMDKFISGDYLTQIPRWANVFYTLLMFIPLFIKRMRKELYCDKNLRIFMITAYLCTFFSMWATLGYSDPFWLPSFHRTIAFLSNVAYSTKSTIGDLVVKLFGIIVQVLRFPHRFEFVMFVFGCVLMPMSLVWIEDRLQLILPKPHFIRESNTRSRIRLDTDVCLPILLAVIAMVPMISNWTYTRVLFSGNFSNFLAAYPVGPLKQVKDALSQLPIGKVIMLPPAESAKVNRDINGVDHKFIDKFTIYFLDFPSYYYGLTGNSDNKNEFFLLLRALYYKQPWWINIVRDLNVKYIIINRELIANPTGGQEYLRGMELNLVSELDQRSTFLTRLMENESYILYEFTDLPTAERVPLYIDTSWNSFIRILSSNLELTRYYDLRYSMISLDLADFDSLLVITDNEFSTALDLYVHSHPNQFFRPASSIMPFNSNLASSDYYLSPMFRMFQFFSNNKWNRLNMITPGLWGTIDGGFIGVANPTQFRIDVTLPQDGEYHLFLRGAATSNQVKMTSNLFREPVYLELRSDPANMLYYDQQQIFATQRQSFDISSYSQAELDKLIPSQIVPINSQYQYFDLGTVSGKKGKHTLYFDKTDSTPLLVEGVVLLPETDYKTLSLPANVKVIQPGALCCSTLTLPFPQDP